MGRRRSAAGPGGLTPGPPRGITAPSLGTPDGRGPLLALASAVCYGVVDFPGGLLSRRAHFAAVTFLGRIGGLRLPTTAALLLGAEAVCPADLLWGALSGVGSAAAMHFLNRGLSHGAMSVVVPVSAVTGVGLSVVCGVLLGDRPTAVARLGIALTAPALRMVCGGGTDGGGGVALPYIALAQAGAAAVLVLLPPAARHPGRLRLRPVRAVQALAPPSHSSSVCSPPSGSCRPSPSSWPPSTRPFPWSSDSPCCTSG